MNKPVLNIVSGGMGNPELYSQESLDIMKNSTTVLTTKRIGDQLKKSFRNIHILDINEIMLELENSNNDVTVIVSGDCGFYSLSKIIIEKFHYKYNIRSFSGTNSMQYLLSKLNKSYDDILHISLHGRKGMAVSAVAYNPEVFLLCDNHNTVKKIISDLRKSGIKGISITIGENLSSKHERIITGDIESLYNQDFSDLSVMYIENNNYANRHCRLCDNDFIRDKVPMTKENIRTISIDRLEILPTDIVYDVGAGTGSVSVAAAYKAYSGKVYSIEKSMKAINLIEKNRIKFGAYNIDIVHGNAPVLCKELPMPDKAFIGGSSGNLNIIIKWLVDKNPNIVLCINTVTLESLSKAVECMKEYDFFDVDISCINCSNAHKIGGYNFMKADNPVYIISGRH